MMNKNFLLLTCCSFISIHSMQRLAAAYTSLRSSQGRNLRTFCSDAKNAALQNPKEFLFGEHPCDCFTPAVIARSKLDRNAPTFWKQHHAQAIRHKVTNTINLNAIEDHEWVITDEQGKTWSDYTRSALIKFAAKKDARRNAAGTSQHWWFSNNNSLDIRTKERILLTSTPTFNYKVSEDTISFARMLRQEKSFSMAINIDDKEIPLLHPNEPLPENWEEIIKTSIDCITHFNHIPWYIALKSLEHRDIKSLNAHQKLAWASLSANGYNMLTKIQSGDVFLWSIEHLVPDRQKLATEIRKDLYSMIVHEMGIVSKGWMAMAQGNTQLAQDLEGLYHHVQRESEDLAQQTLDEFCKRWSLEDIKLRELESNNKQICT